jgi:hypothetical protein
VRERAGNATPGRAQRPRTVDVPVDVAELVDVLVALDVLVDVADRVDEAVAVDVPVALDVPVDVADLEDVLVPEEVPVAEEDDVDWERARRAGGGGRGTRLKEDPDKWLGAVRGAKARGNRLTAGGARHTTPTTSNMCKG